MGAPTSCLLSERMGGPCVVTTSVRVWCCSDARTSKAVVVPLATAASRSAMDLDPANAIAISTAAQRSTQRWHLLVAIDRMRAGLPRTVSYSKMDIGPSHDTPFV